MHLIAPSPSATRMTLDMSLFRACSAAPDYVRANTPVRSNAPILVENVALRSRTFGCPAGTLFLEYSGWLASFHADTGPDYPSRSFQLDNLENVFCPELIPKKLPGCEHEATMRCSDDPRRYSCRETCSGIMSCCGRSCKARCHECQSLNAAPESLDDKGDDVVEEQHPVQRVMHLGHPCQKSLFCGHLCGKQCSSDHECTLECKEACRQVCTHARCRNYCSVPCAPCQEPCAWYVLRRILFRTTLTVSL